LLNPLHRLREILDAHRKERPVNFDLAALEGHFAAVAHDVNDALHSQVAQVIEDAAKAVLPLIPEGSVVEGLLAKFDAVASEAHSLLAAALPPAPEAPPEAPEVPAEPVATEPAPAVSPEAPAAPETPPETTAGQARPQ
jgi:hypothetical protein